MQKPNLDRLWQVWIKIGIPQSSYQDLSNSAVNTIRTQVAEVVSILETRNVIDWYYFLIHGRENDVNLYFHCVFSLKDNVKSEEFTSLLPSYCLYPEHLGRGYGEAIAGINKGFLKDGEIEEAWRIIGKQSEWIIDLVRSHKDGPLPVQQFIQFMHYYMNMMGLGNQSILFLSPILRF